MATSFRSIAQISNPFVPAPPASLIDRAWRIRNVAATNQGRYIDPQSIIMFQSLLALPRSGTLDWLTWQWVLFLTRPQQT